MRQGLYLDPCPWCGWLCCEEDKGAVKTREGHYHKGEFRPTTTRVFCSQDCHDLWYYGP